MNWDLPCRTGTPASFKKRIRNLFESTTGHEPSPKGGSTYGALRWFAEQVGYDYAYLYRLANGERPIFRRHWMLLTLVEVAVKQQREIRNLKAALKRAEMPLTTRGNPFL